MSGDDIFLAVVELHEAKGLAPLNEIGVWQEALPGGWYIAVNGRRVAEKVAPPDGMEVEVPPYELAVWFNGWLAGLIHPIGGGVLAAGAAANADTLLESLQEARVLALRQAQGGRGE